MATAWGSQGKKISPSDFKSISQGKSTYNSSTGSVVPKPNTSTTSSPKSVSSPMPSSSVPRPSSSSTTSGSSSSYRPSAPSYSVPSPPSSTTSTAPRNTGTTSGSSVPKPPGYSAPTTSTAPRSPTSSTGSVPRPNNYVAPTDKNYVAHGGQDLNDLLYLKRTYETNPNNTGLQNYASTAAKDIYGKLGDQASYFQGMNAQQLEDYILGSRIDNDPVPQPTGGGFPSFSYSGGGSDPIPSQEPAIPVLDWDAIQKYAKEQQEAELLRQRSAADQAIAAGKLTSEQQVAALRQAAERLRGDMTEQRGIENVENARRLSPFSGRSDFAQGMIERERGKTDRQLAENQQMQEANIAGNLAQLENEINAKYLALEQTSGAERERIMQSLRESERQYDLALAQQEVNRQIANSQIKNTDFNQNLASWQANRGAYEFDKNFGLQEGALTGNYRGTPTLASQQFQWQKDTDTRNFEFEKANTLWNQAFQQNQFDFQKAQSAWDQAFKEKSFQQGVQEAAQSRGLQWAQLNQQQQQFLAREAWDKQMYQEQQAWKQKEWDWMMDPTNPENAPKPSQSDPYNKLMSEALTAAQKDTRWFSMTEEERQSLIQYYAQLLAPQQPGGLSDSDILQYLK